MRRKQKPNADCWTCIVLELYTQLLFGAFLIYNFGTCKIKCQFMSCSTHRSNWLPFCRKPLAIIWHACNYSRRWIQTAFEFVGAVKGRHECSVNTQPVDAYTWPLVSETKSGPTSEQTELSHLSAYSTCNDAKVVANDGQLPKYAGVS